MAHFLRTRSLPLMMVAGLGAGIYWQTAGGSQQPASRQYSQTAATPGKDNQAPVSEAFQKIAGTGGTRARDEQHLQVDPKDTHIPSMSTDVASKRHPTKTRDQDKVVE
ncbi:hypothetical protein B0H66DRAFT_383735 [Apodospora peruviana]|uniref:Uncharacterized protein n=1 Tax=Apodospora peruviana TaxID=516989 RepID=A0AAE0HU68_9PEZI|nr:hypothetical protein B0H66DRAFT_383735 [Apodospora peruviana]